VKKEEEGRFTKEEKKGGKAGRVMKK